MKDATGMTLTAIPFELHCKSGVLKVCCETNISASKSGFDLFASRGFDVEMCIGFPAMHLKATPNGAGSRTFSGKFSG